VSRSIGSDYALFYAYIQTDPEDPTQLWAAAAQLAEINGKLFYNFLEGIKAAGLRPKRVLLQTGEKVTGGEERHWDLHWFLELIMVDL
jgi:hypothetical protein